MIRSVRLPCCWVLQTKVLFTTPLNAGPGRLPENIGGIWLADQAGHGR